MWNKLESIVKGEREGENKIKKRERKIDRSIDIERAEEVRERGEEERERR